MSTIIQSLTADLRYGARQLRHSPIFTIVAVLTLALGMGANAAIFSLINAILFKTLPVENPQELRHLVWTSQKPAFAHSTSNTGNRTPNGEIMYEYFSYPAYVAVRDRTSSFSELFCFTYGGTNLGIGGHAEWGQAQLISGNYFRALGARRVNIVRIVLCESLLPVISGITIGLGGAIILTRLVQNLYFGISPNDPLSIICAIAALLLAATLAAMLPAHRASGIDPMQALRNE